jgi:hypothetical protein
VRRLFCALTVLTAAAAGCGCQDKTANEARLFLDRAGRIEIDGPRQARRDRIDALAGLALEDPQIVAARDLCVEAHRTLFDAEETQASAQTELDRITKNGADPNADIEPAVAARLDRQITEARRGIDRSHELMPRCQDEVGELTRRYAQQR